jgi:hypothetical protein
MGRIKLLVGEDRKVLDSEQYPFHDNYAEFIKITQVILYKKTPWLWSASEQRQIQTETQNIFRLIGLLFISGNELKMRHDHFFVEITWEM